MDRCCIRRAGIFRGGVRPTTAAGAAGDYISDREMDKRVSRSMRGTFSPLGLRAVTGACTSRSQRVYDATLGGKPELRRNWEVGMGREGQNDPAQAGTHRAPWPATLILEPRPLCR